MQLAKTLLALATLTLLSPAANATWMFAQSWEPDTPYDAQANGFAWDGPGPVGEKRIYFAAFSYQADTGVNPNLGALQTRNEVPADEYNEALFGVWVDCNGDGYVGMIETAVREYSNKLLLDDSTCPPATGSNQKWNGAHNYNGLVTELIPIIRGATNRDVRTYVDPEARVWGDFDRPDMHPEHRSCPLNPQPRGTYQTTGGALNYVDCRVDVLGGSNRVFDGIGDPASLHFADEDEAHSGALGNIDTFGSEDASHSAITIQDCSAAPLVRSGDLLNQTPLGPLTADETGGGTAHDIEIGAPSPGTRDLATPTIPGTYNETNEELSGDCDTSNDAGHDFYGGILGEADFNGVNPNNKHEAEFNFGSTTSNRGGAPVSLLGAIGGPGSAGMNENDAGIGWGGSRWQSDSAWLSKPGPGTVRADLSGDIPSASIAPAYWLTFYAHAGSVIRNRAELTFPGGLGEYGSWACGENESGIHNGWNCDDAEWYKNPDGTYIPDPNGRLVHIGQPYEFRDVDCYDGGNAAGVPLAPAAYGDAPCP